MSPQDSTASFSLDGERMLADLSELGRIGWTPDGAEGMQRPAFGPDDLAGREWVEARMRELDMSVRRDAIGNTIGLYAGTEPSLPSIAVGSHTDSVPSGGRFDGALGVIAGLSCVRALHTAGLRLRHPLELINFAAEEATVGGGLLGSRAMTGQLDSGFEKLAAWDGGTVASKLAEAGLDASRASEACRTASSLVAFLELHIEQGPILEHADAEVGVVDTIVGVRTYRVRFDGQANHAGTTPMAQRNDALVAAAGFVTAVPEIACRHGIVATVGQAIITPGAPNVIPGRVEMTLDARGAKPQALDAAAAELRDAARSQGGELSPNTTVRPVQTARRITEIVDLVAQRRDLAVMHLDSGGGHDAMCMASITDAAMLFVPSRGGLSHAPGEHTEPSACCVGAQVLLDAVLEIDRSYDPEVSA